MSGARGDFVASLPRRLEVLRAALRAVEDQPRDAGRINGLLRRLHALGSAARVLGFASVAEALGEAEKTLRRAARSGPAPTDLADVARALDLLPSLVLGAKVSIRATVPEPAARQREVLDEVTDLEKGVTIRVRPMGLTLCTTFDHARIGHALISMAERSPSVSRLNEIEVRKIITPGSAQSNGCV